MANFDRYSNYNAEAGISSVVFGANAPVLEVELNEMQEIQKNLLSSTIKNLLGDGISDLSAVSYDHKNSLFRINDGCFIAVNGYLIQSTDLYINNVAGSTVYLQVWEDTVDYTSVLKKGGSQQSSSTVPNYIKDSRMPSETTKRKVVKSMLSTTTDSNKHNIDIASVSSDGVLAKHIKEINLAKLSDKVVDLQAFTGFHDDGVLGIEVDLEKNTVKRVGDNENWVAGDEYLNSPIYSGRKRCIVADDGVVIAYYGDNAYTETGALTVSVSGTNRVTYSVGTKVQCMVIQPKFYYRRVPLRLAKQVGTSTTYAVKGHHLVKWVDLISPFPREGFTLHPAFKKGDTELDYYFIGENEGCVENSNGTYDLTDSMTIPASPYTGYKFSSIAGAKPATGATKAGLNTVGSKSLTIDAVRQMCANRGTDWQQLDITILSAEQMLFLIEYATFKNSETELGDGNSRVPCVTNVNDACSSPINNTLGNKSGVIEFASPHSNGSNYSAKVPVYRGVKNPFSNCMKYVDGVLRNLQSTTSTGDNEVYWESGNDSFSNDLTKHTSSNFSCATKSGFIMYFGYSKECDFVYIPSLIGGTSVVPVGSSYTTDMGKTGSLVFKIGAVWNSVTESRMFQMDNCSLPSSSDFQTTGRLCRKSAKVIFAM